MPEIKVYLPADGRVVIRWPKGTIPDRTTLERLTAAIMYAKKNPSACANMQKGSTENGAVVGQFDCIASAAESQ